MRFSATPAVKLLRGFILDTVNRRDNLERRIVDRKKASERWFEPNYFNTFRRSLF